MVVPASAKGGRKRPPPKPAPAAPAAPADDRPAAPSDAAPAAVGDTGSSPGGATADAKEKKGKKGEPKTFDFTALDLNGRMRSPQLLYFLERANEELERASLEKRSFIPHMVRSLDEEQL